jgi:hypothetical protein
MGALEEVFEEAALALPALAFTIPVFEGGCFAAALASMVGAAARMSAATAAIADTKDFI